MMQQAIRHVMGTAVLFGWVATSALAQDPMKTFPKNYWVEFENPYFEVIHVRYRAHEKVGVHDHSDSPTVYVYLSDSGPVQFIHAGHDTFDLTRKPLQTGQMRVSPGRRETHRVENLGDLQSDFLRVELKTLPLGSIGEKRIPAAGGTGEETVFDDPKVRVSRLILQNDRLVQVQGAAKGKTLWIAVRAEGAKINGKTAHAGQAWDTQKLDIDSTNAQAAGNGESKHGVDVQVVKIELK